MEGGERRGQRWSLAYQNITELPQGLAEKYGAVITELDLSHNKIVDLRCLAEFPALETVVLDHNLLTSHVKLPPLPHLHTLWLNHNRITNLGMFVSTVALHCPNLRILSMMNNEAAPSFFNGGSYQQYMDFRYYVISRLPKLEVLDYKPVSIEEREEASRIYGARRKNRQAAKLEQSAMF
ncbi:leucine-rich melanocyte differentiation-associated protein-like [Babylonia areolata]|uniref:leucine-rich melanocyte differentiation-associated protein-like n=1 Tax=Babylonia areolata TaxID=304850 RepID=UPI003FD45C06